MTRSRWRVFLTVFLVVFLGGFGVSGAAALWSVKTNATASVTTGTWFSEGFQWDPQVEFTNLGTDGGITGWYQDGRFTWTPPAGAGDAQYRVSFTPLTNNRQEVRSRIDNPLKVSSLSFQTTRPWVTGDPEVFMVKFVAVVGSAQSAPACYTYTLYSNRDTTQGQSAKISPRQNCS